MDKSGFDRLETAFLCAEKFRLEAAQPILLCNNFKNSAAARDSCLPRFHANDSRAVNAGSNGRKTSPLPEVLTSPSIDTAHPIPASTI